MSRLTAADKPAPTNDEMMTASVLPASALANSCRALGCEPSDLVNVRKLDKGHTNVSYIFDVRADASGAGSYIYRHPGNGTSAIISMIANSIRIRADFLFTGAKLQINSEFCYRLTQIITELRVFIQTCQPISGNDARRPSQISQDCAWHLRQSVRCLDGSSNKTYRHSIPPVPQAPQA